MSDTPRTDQTDMYDYQTAVDFARQLERELSAANEKNSRLCAIISPAQRALAVVSQFRKCIEDPNSFFMDLCGKPEPIAQLTEIYDALKKALEPFEEQTPGCGHIGVTQ